VDEKESLLLWPCVEIGNENVDPLRDSRVMKMLRKLDISDCSVTWSFGQEGKKEHQRLKSADSIATNTLGQFLVRTSTTHVSKFSTLPERSYIRSVHPLIN